MSNFVPELGGHDLETPMFEDARAEDGWAGHTTKKSTERLKDEVMISLARLGAQVSFFQKGTFFIDSKERDGYRIQYTVSDKAGRISAGVIEVAALPVDKTHRRRETLDARREQSLKCALFMLRDALDGAWRMKILCPDYEPLVPWMLDAKTGQTVSKLWSVGGDVALLEQGEAVDAEFQEV